MHNVCVLAFRYDMLGHPAGTERGFVYMEARGPELSPVQERSRDY